MHVLRKLEQGDLQGNPLTREDAAGLLDIDVYGGDFHRLLALSDKLSRSKFRDRGLVFAQIGINAAPCSKNCAFCSMGKAHYAMDAQWQKNISEIRSEVGRLLAEQIDDLFLMTTADYPQDVFLDVVQQVRTILPESVRLVANIGDFTLETARRLKGAGCTGAYHICRLREGKDTGIDPQEREKTLEAIVGSGLELYYCIEPIGPEHGREELVAEMLRARQLGVAAMAAMRRIPVPGTPLFPLGQITALELTKIVAVANLVVNPSRCLNVHEPMQMPLLAGVNQFYAEMGANPRDTCSRTEVSRGFSPARAWELLAEGGWRRGPAKAP
jgi:biotin synthase